MVTAAACERVCVLTVTITPQNGLFPPPQGFPAADIYCVPDIDTPRDVSEGLDCYAPRG